MLLTMVDAHSKWIEALPSSSSTSGTTIDHLCQLFATHGLPDTIDRQWPLLHQHRFRNVSISQRHRAHSHIAVPSNDKAESATQTMKHLLKKMKYGSMRNASAKHCCSITSRHTPRQAFCHVTCHSTDTSKPKWSISVLSNILKDLGSYHSGHRNKASRLAASGPQKAPTCRKLDAVSRLAWGIPYLDMLGHDDRKRFKLDVWSTFHSIS